MRASTLRTVGHVRRRVFGWRQWGRRIGTAAILLACLTWARDPSVLAQAQPGGPVVMVPGSATLPPGEPMTFLNAPGCPRGAPGQPTPSCGCCVPRFFTIKNESDQTAGVSYGSGTLEVLLPEGFVPQVYSTHPDIFFFRGCEPVEGRANDVRCAIPLGGGPPGAAAAVTIRAQPASESLQNVAVSADTSVALVPAHPPGELTALDGLAAVNRSPLPAQLSWDSGTVTLTVMPGFTPLLTGLSPTTLAGCGAVEEQPNTVRCTAGVDLSVPAFGVPSPAAPVVRLSFTAVPADATSETANVEPGSTAVFLGAQPDPVSGAVPVVTVQHLTPPDTIGGTATWDGEALTINGSPAVAVEVKAADNAVCASSAATPSTASCTATGVPLATVAFASSQERIEPAGPPIFDGRLVNPPQTGSVGESLTFAAEIRTAAPGFTPPPGLTVQSVDWDFGDGTTASGTTVTHTYAAAGIYAVGLAVEDSHGTRVLESTTVEIFPAGAPVKSTSVEVSYPAGWNLVAGSSFPTDSVQAVGTNSTVFSSADALFTLLPDGSDYAHLPQNTPLAAGIGYWAYFASPTDVSVAGEPRPLQRPLPADRWTLIGNPFTSTADVSGADLVYFYDPDTGAYVATTVLQPGQGAWAYSAAGGTVTISPGQ